MSSSEKPARGQPFNPWRGSCGFYPPDIVGRDRSLGLTDGQKRLHERLVRYAGRDGHCWPSQATLAAELGKAERQVRYDLGKLRAAGLIGWHSRKAKNGRGNVYQFPWHPIFERQAIAGQVEALDDSSGNPLPVTSGDTLPVDVEVCRSRAASVPLSNGNPLPWNSVQEEYTEKRASEEYCDSEEQRSPAAHCEKRNQAPEERELSAKLEGWGVAFKPDDPHSLVSASRESGATPDQLFMFIADKITEKRRAGDRVRNARFLLNIIPDELRAWLCRNGIDTDVHREKRLRPKADCPKCQGNGWEIIERNGASGAIRCDCASTPSERITEDRDQKIGLVAER